MPMYQKPSFRLLTWVAFVLLVLVTISLVTWQALSSSRHLVGEYVGLLREAAIGRMEHEVQNLLASNDRLLDLMVSQAAYRGERDEVQARFLDNIKHNPLTGAIFYGAEDKSFVGVERRPDGTIILTRSDVGTGHAFVGQRLTENGERGEEISRQPNYDPRNRPWYRSALPNAEPRWTEVYYFAPHRSLFVTVVQAIRDSRRQIEGVMAVGIQLKGIDRFLKQLDLGPNGRAFILEPSGLMVASSEGGGVDDSAAEPARRHATASPDPLIRAAAAQAVVKAGALDRISMPVEFTFETEGGTHRARLQPSVDSNGMVWLLGVVLSDADFEAPLLHQRNFLLSVALVILIVAGLLGALAGSRITNAIQMMAAAAQRLAAGHLDQTMPAMMSREFTQFGDAFVAMANKIRENIATLELRVAERTRELDDKNQALLTEVQERRKAEEEARREHALVMGFIDSLPGIFYLIDRQGRYVLWNRAQEFVTGYSPEEMKDRHPLDFFLGEDRALIESRIGQVFQTGSGEVEASLVTKDGRSIPYFFTGRRIFIEGQPHLIGVGIDISQLKAAEERIRHLASHDNLTGLPNRNLLEDRLAKAMALAKRQQAKLGVLFIDLDGFKAVNDRMGHSAGDLVLKEVAQRLQECVRDADTVARLGCDEFIILLMPAMAEGVLTRVVGKILDAISRPYWIGEREAQIGASIGVAFYPDHGETVEDILGGADRAMYVAKEHGKGTFAIAKPIERVE